MYRCFGSAAANMLSQQVSYYEQLVCRFRGCYAAKLAALPDHQGEFLFPRQSITDCRKLGMSLQVYHGERQEIGCVVVLREVESTGGCQCAPQSISIIKVQILVFHRCLVRVQAVIVECWLLAVVRLLRGPRRRRVQQMMAWQLLRLRRTPEDSSADAEPQPSYDPGQLWRWHLTSQAWVQAVANCASRERYS